MFDLEFYLEFYEHLQAKKDDGWKVVGFLAHEFIPEELLLAARVVPLPLVFAGSEQLTQDGTVYLSPTTCVYARSIVGAFDPENRGARFKFLELVDGLVCTNYCNAENVAIQTICKRYGLRRFDFFLTTNTEGQSMKLLYSRLKRLRRELEEFTGREISDGDIWLAIEKYNGAREALGRLLRSDLPDLEIQETFKRGILMGPDWVAENVGVEGVEALGADPPRGEASGGVAQGGTAGGSGSWDAPAVALFGCPAFIGDSLVELLEDAGMRVSVDCTWLGTGYCERSLLSVDPSGDPLKKMLDIYARGDSVRQVPNSVEHETRRVLNAVSKFGLSGVLHHQVKFCDMVPFLQDEFRARLQTLGVKYLWIERDYTSQDSGQLVTRVEAFKETMEG
ncbi:MAG: 2-hydroxyacyl-CoA dehydratase family protein [Promethearchaeota archaeon]